MVRGQGFVVPNESLTERTFYVADGWMIQQGLYRHGEQLARTHSEVGKYQSGSLISIGKQGHLVFGPYVHMSAGEYTLTVLGSAPSVSATYVDVVSGKGSVTHAKFPVTSTEGDETTVLVSKLVYLDEDVSDLEVRVWVGRSDEIRMDGYQLVAVNTPLSSPD